LLSLKPRHFRRSVFPLCVLHATTSLRPFAPRALPRFHATMGVLTPARTVLRRLSGRMNSVTDSARVSPIHATRPSYHSASTHPLPRPHRFRTLPLSARADRRTARFRASSAARRLAGNSRPYRVRHPADWSFTSRCSPPRLAATQLRSVTGRRASARGGLPPP